MRIMLTSDAHLADLELPSGQLDSNGRLLFPELYSSELQQGRTTGRVHDRRSTGVGFAVCGVAVLSLQPPEP